MTRKTTWPGRPLALALALCGLLALPAVSQAATKFGSRMANEPANSGECAALIGGCTWVSFIHPTDPDGDPYSGGAPVDGVITKFRIRAFGESPNSQVTFRLANLTVDQPGQSESALATAAGTGPTVTIQPAPEGGEDVLVQEFDGRLKVTKGQYLAIDGTDVHATYNNSGNKFTYYYAPPLVDGQGARGSTDNKGELLVNADIEPDADGDGFGDETQDTCPTQPTTQGACDTAGPGVSGLGVAGGKIRYSLNEDASVTFRLEKAKKGRRVRGKCRRQTKRNRTKRRCSRFVKLKGEFSQEGKQGSNELSLPRVGGRKLGPGRYRLVMTARDAVGNETTTVKKFRIKRKKRRR